MDLMIESLPRLLKATILTIELTFLSLFFGIFVGAFFAILRTSKNKIFYLISYYYSYVFRGAIQSIHRGQFEASEVLGFKKKIYYYKIIFPQMLRLALPNISNVWQITLKDTSLISVTGLVEIMRQSYIAAGSTRDPLFFYSFAAILYLLLTYISMELINKLELKYSRGF